MNRTTFAFSSVLKNGLLIFAAFVIVVTACAFSASAAVEVWNGVYVDGVRGDDNAENAGDTPANPLLTFREAYTLLQGTGGTIYVVDTVTIPSEVTLASTYYEDSDGRISIFNGCSVVIKRYSQPKTVYEGFDVISNLNALILVDSGGVLTLDGITIDGHKNAVTRGHVYEVAGGVAATSAVLHVAEGGTAEIKGATIQNNNNTVSSNYNRTGGGVYNAGTLTLSNAVITGNEVFAKYGGSGGGIYSIGTLNIADSVISDNSTGDRQGDGGGIFNAGTIAFSGAVTISGNTANSGGGIFSETPMTLGENILIENNDAYFGGGVYMYNDATLTLDGAIISENTANQGGGIWLQWANMTMHSGKVSNNQAYYGGAIHLNGTVSYNNVGYLTVLGGEISYNKASDKGGAIYNYSGAIIMEGGSMSYNGRIEEDDNLRGGAIFLDADGTLTMTGGEISYNEANSGGGVYLVPYGVHPIAYIKGNAEIKYNIADFYGGGILNYDSEVYIDEDAVISNNTAYTGGGIHNEGYTTISGGSIIDNEASGDGGGVYNIYELVMNGGVIQNNTAAGNGGGVYNSDDDGNWWGYFGLTGGTISGNAAAKGEGVYQDGILEVKVSPVVSQTVFLTPEHYITVVDVCSSSFITGMDEEDTFDGRVIANYTFNSSGQKGHYSLNGSTQGYADAKMIRVWDDAPSEGDYPYRILLRVYGGYVDGVNGSDSNTGASPEDAVKTFRQAYENLYQIGGTIYVVNTVRISSEITLDSSFYKDAGGRVDIINGKTVMIKRYSQPLTVGVGFNVASNLNALIKVDTTGKLMLSNIAIDGHKDAVTSGNVNQIANGVAAADSLLLNDGTLIIKDGAWIRNHLGDPDEYADGAIYSQGSIVMEGGKISDCSGYTGGAISVIFDSSFVMTGGVITNNTATLYGGGIYLNGNNAVFTMSGGEISYNTADISGGGIYSNYGHIVINGGKISYNRSLDDYHLSGGGAVCLYGGATITMNGGELSHNTATTNGGAILLFPYGKGISEAIIQGDAVITGNEAYCGGGIFNYVCEVTVNGNAVISNNKADYGGGVYNYGEETIYTDGGGNFYVKGGTITGNDAISGAGVYNGGYYSSDSIGGHMYMSGGTITNNRTSDSPYYNEAIYNWIGIIEFSGGLIEKSNVGIYNDAGTVTMRSHAEISSCDYYSVYQEGLFQVKDAPVCEQAVFLTPDHYIHVIGPCTSDFITAMDDEDTFEGRVLAYYTFDTSGQKKLYSLDPTTQGFADAKEIRVGDKALSEGEYPYCILLVVANQEYSVIYDGNGADSGSMEAEIFIIDVEKALAENEFSKVGYIFVEWNTKPDGSGARYADMEIVKNLCSADGEEITLYAQWKAIVYIIQYDGNGNTGGFTAPSEHTYDVESTLTPNGFIKAGYKFDCWVDEDGNVYQDGQAVINLSTKDGDVIVLYARWKAIIFGQLRFIKLDYFETLSENSKWRFGTLKDRLLSALSEDLSDTSNCVQVWHFSAEDYVKAHEWCLENKKGRETNIAFFAQFKDGHLTDPSMDGEGSLMVAFDPVLGYWWPSDYDKYRYLRSGC